MPNGADKNFRRLLMACAAHRQRFGEWPTQARMSAGLLQNLAGLFDLANFERLAAHLELRTQDHVGLSVGGRGVTEYGQVDHGRLDPELLVLAERWLGIAVRPDLDEG